MRESLSPGSGVEFRGYVPEEAIPDLFQTSTVVVMPYDSATGSSGPAHQACEYGVPIISADIPDFRRMAEDEDMAISFYKPGDPEDLAEKLIEILQSPEQQRQLAHHNFSAAMRMTMPSVVRHYLRWFELSRHRQTASGLVRFPLLHSRRSLSRRSAILRQASKSSWNWSLNSISMPGSAEDATSDSPLEGSSVSGDYRVPPNSDLPE